MTAIKKLIDGSGNQYFPQTHTKAVVDDNGYSVESKMQAVQDVVNQAQMGIGAVPSDLTPTEGSTNWVTSGGVYNAIQVVQSDVSELEEELYGSVHIEWITGKYIATNQGVGATCPMAETTLPEMDYAKIKASVGETYHLIGVGGNTPRLWAMVDLNTSKIISAAAGYTSTLDTPEDVTLTITQDCWLIVNVYNGQMNPPYQNNANIPYSLNRTAYGQSRIDLLEENDKTINVSWSGGGAIDSSIGVVIGVSDKKYSDYIDISDYDYLYISNIIINSISQSGLAFYDSGKTYISGEPCTFSFENGVDIKKYIVPNRAQYVRLTFWNTDTYGTFKIYGAKATDNNYELPNISVYATNEYSDYGLEQGTNTNGSFVSSETRVHLPLISVPTHVSVKSDYYIIYVGRLVNGSYDNTYDSIDTYKLRRSLYLPKIDGVAYIVVIARKDNGAILPTDDIIEDMSYLDYEDKLANMSSKKSNNLSYLTLSEEETVVGTAMNYILKDEYENSVRYLRLSEDCGKTWTSIQNTFGDIVFVHWFSNGDLLFATPSKCYYSNDGLTTVNESELYDLDGTTFVAEATEHFFQNDQSRNPIMMVGNTELVAWGDYYFNEAAYKGRAWYSDDYGHSVKCFFKSGESVIGGETISVRHTHGVLYDKYTEKFYLITGDYNSECCLIECLYSHDGWNLTLLGQGVNYKFGDIRFDKYFAYFVTDYTETSLPGRGILRCPKNGLSNYSNYKFIAKTPSNYTGSVLSFIEDRNGNKLMFPDLDGRGKIWYCRNTLNFETVLVSEDRVLTNVTEPNYNGDVYCRKSLSTTPFKLNPMINLTKSMRNSGVKDFFDQNNIINVSSNEL